MHYSSNTSYKKTNGVLIYFWLDLLHLMEEQPQNFTYQPVFAFSSLSIAGDTMTSFPWAFHCPSKSPKPTHTVKSNYIRRLNLKIEGIGSPLYYYPWALCSSYYSFTLIWVQLNFDLFQNNNNNPPQKKTDTQNSSNSLGYLKFSHISPAVKIRNFVSFFFSWPPSSNRQILLILPLQSLLFRWPQIPLITPTLVTWFLPFLLPVCPINWVQIICFLNFLSSYSSFPVKPSVAPDYRNKAHTLYPDMKHPSRSHP